MTSPRPWLRRLSLLPLLFLGSTAAGQDRLAPSQPHEVVAGLVAYSLDHFHYSGQRLDDDTSREWMRQYTRALDPSRVFFTAQDVAEISRYQTKLDDAMSMIPADLSPGFEIHARYRKGILAYCDHALEALQAPDSLPFRDVEIPADRSEAPWPVDEAERAALWDERITEQRLRLVLQGLSEEDARDKLRKRFERLKRDIEETETSDVLEVYLGALGTAFDPHSAWFAPANKEDFDIEMSDSLEGIGATLVREEDYITVRSLVAGGPAEKGGDLQPGDRISAVTQDGETVDVVGMRIDHVVRLIRGPKNTEVILTVTPAGATDMSEAHDVKIMRDKVIIADAAASGTVREVDGVKLGVIDVPSFYASRGFSKGKGDQRSTTEDVERILEDFRSQGVASVLIDLRRNGGGLLTEAISLTGLFIDRGPVVQIRDREGKVDVLSDRDGGTAWDGPVAILTSPYSASASEIFAGALQDYGRGLVLGASSTHGKGTVQQFQDLTPFLASFKVSDPQTIAGALKYTTDQFYRVSGRSTQQVGVEADVVIPSMSDGLGMGEGELPNALDYDEVPPARYSHSDLKLNLDKLRKRSAQRVAKSPQFQLMAEMRTYREAQKDAPISLDLERRRAERESWNALKDKGEKAGLWDEEQDPVLDEAILVARDMVKG